MCPGQGPSRDMGLPGSGGELGPQIRVNGSWAEGMEGTVAVVREGARQDSAEIHSGDGSGGGNEGPEFQVSLERGDQSHRLRPAKALAGGGGGGVGGILHQSSLSVQRWAPGSAE